MKSLRTIVAGIALVAVVGLVLAPLTMAQGTAAPAKTEAPAAKAPPKMPTMSATTAAPAKAPAKMPTMSATAAAPAKAPAKATAGTAAASPKGGVTSGVKTIVGEVVDPACWVVNGAKGETHKECTIACAKAGQVLGILEAKTNKLYLIATENPGEDPNKGVIDFAGQKVTVTGKFFTRGGVTVVKISSITPGGTAK